MKQSLSKNPKDFLMGTDSEYIIRSGRKVIKASDYVSIEEPFGRDANGFIFEVKSEPGDPVQVVESLKNILNSGAQKFPELTEFNWQAGSFVCGQPLGGHIHFGIKKMIISPEDAAKQFLDHYVGAVSVLLEDKKQGLSRRAYNLSPGGNKVSYGKSGDVRLKKHGFEYRTCSSFMTSPEVAKGILCLGKVVMFEVINNPSFSPRVYIEPEDFVQMNIEKIRARFDSLWADIQRMILYPKYRQELRVVYDLIVNGKSWVSRRDMKDTWGIKIIPVAASRNTKQAKDLNDFELFLKKLDEGYELPLKPKKMPPIVKEVKIAPVVKRRKIVKAPPKKDSDNSSYFYDYTSPLKNEWLQND